MFVFMFMYVSSTNAAFLAIFGTFLDPIELLMASIAASASGEFTPVFNSAVCNVMCWQNQGLLCPAVILNA